MKILEFVEGYNESKQKKAFVDKHITKHYLPYEDKIVQAKNIIERSSYQEVNGESIFKLNAPMRYMMFIISIIELYTDIEWELTEIDGKENADKLSGFNLLEETNLTEVILNSIGADIKRFETILNMVLDDTLDENRSLVPFLETKIKSMGLWLNILENALEKLDVNPEKIE